MAHDSPSPRTLADIQYQRRLALEKLRPLYFNSLAVVGIVNSIITTVLCCIYAQLRIEGQWTALAVMIGVPVAVLLTIGQYMTSDGPVLAYAFFLLPDVLMTAYPHSLWLFVVLSAFVPSLVAAVLTLVGALSIGLISAMYPERQFYGRRLHELSTTGGA
jgi:hypothetical protein